ncbi:DUF6234 family protein [Streptomyces sp. NPDC101150]|uniref:DUF6234 family protein n=1 Tax=Streptomyces sp. NPDC101150 TaxID=3366114 RepID=UPI0038269458
MLTWAVDVLLGVALAALEVTALVAFWFWGSVKLWAAGGKPVPGAAVRLWLVLTAGPAGLALAAFTAFRAGLPVTGVSQSLVAAALCGVLLLGLGTEFSRWAARRFGRS